MSDPEKELDGETVGRLMFHQLTGLGLLSRLVLLNITLDPTASLINWRRESWNTKGLTSGSYAAPILTRIGAGQATLVYAANVPDWTGEDAQLVFYGGGGESTEVDSSIYKVRVVPTSPASSTVTILTWVWNAGTNDWDATDGDFTVHLE